ncbi:recombinase family protein [Vibrio sp. VNB-15]
MQFAYVRVSTKNQSTDSQTTDIQSSFPNAQLYTDFAVSGTVATMERPELSKVLLQLRVGDELIVWWIDRLGRNYQEIENLIRELLQKGVTIRTINQNLTFVYTGEEPIIVKPESSLSSSN